MEDNILTVNSVSKEYASVQALQNVSFSLNQGESLGLLGRNGSGKTTLLSIICGIKSASSGTFHWKNMQGTNLSKDKVGILLEAPAFYPTLNAIDNLKIVCLIKNTNYAEIESILHEVGLYEKRKIDFQNYSLGMKQRLGVASALIGSPNLLILDEPTNGLDPEGIALIRELIIKKRKEGISVIMASHILDEVEKVCTKLVVLNDGELRYVGLTSDLLNNQNQIQLEYDDLERLSEALDGMSIVLKKEIKDKQLLVTIPQSFKGSDVSKLLVEKGIFLSGIRVREKSLEEEFLKLLKD